MTRDEVRDLKSKAEELEAWAEQLQLVDLSRFAVETDADKAAEALLRTIVDIRTAGEAHIAVMALRESDRHTLNRIARAARLPQPDPGEAHLLDQIRRKTDTATRGIRALCGLRRFFSGTKAKETAGWAAATIRRLHTWGVDDEVVAVLDRLAAPAGEVPTPELTAALSDEVGLAARLPGFGTRVLVPATRLHALAEATGRITVNNALEAKARQGAITVAATLREELAVTAINTMAIDRLRDASRERIRTAPLAQAGITTIGEVLRVQGRIMGLPGIAETSARRILAAAESLWHAPATRPRSSSTRSGRAA